MRLRRPAVLLLAVALDLSLGEPAARWHPVAWIGRALGWAERRAPGRSIGDGAAAVTLVVGSAWAGARALASVAGRLSWMGVVLEALALKPALPCVGSTRPRTAWRPRCGPGTSDPHGCWSGGTL